MVGGSVSEFDQWNTRLTRTLPAPNSSSFFWQSWHSEARVGGTGAIRHEGGVPFTEPLLLPGPFLLDANGTSAPPGITPGKLSRETFGRTMASDNFGGDQIGRSGSPETLTGGNSKQIHMTTTAVQDLLTTSHSP